MQPVLLADTDDLGFDVVLARTKLDCGALSKPTLYEQGEGRIDIAGKLFGVR
jgi:hypothetical protein